jgi:hypothetical protein
MELRWAWLLPLGFLLQGVAFYTPLPSQEYVVGLHLASYAVVVLAIGLNLRLMPLRVLGLGTLANLTAIAANGGFMPASPTALRAAGLERGIAALADRPLANSRLMDEHTLLPFLGDIFALPAEVPLANVFSVGDVLIALGVALLVGQAMARRAPVPAGDYAAALALIKNWPAPTSATRPSGRFLRLTGRHLPLGQA